MKISVRGKNMEVTAALKDYVEKRLGKLEKFSENLQDGHATLSAIRGRHRVEVTIPINGWLLRGEEETDDMYSSIDLVVEKLEKQIDKYKGKLSRKSKNGVKDVVAGAVVEGDDTPQVLRTKKFAIKPMAVDEAIMQMNLLGHSFFVFSNADTEEVNVVYRRKDGNFGHIEPEY